MSAIASDDIRPLLRTRRLGRALHCFGETASTNEYCTRLGLAGAPDGTVVIADSQTAGRGRMGRAWHSPPGCNLHVSFLLRAAVRPETAAGLSIAAGLAAAEVFAAETGCPIAVKWPNDVLASGKKICGVLCELSTDPPSPFAVVGVGANLNMRAEAMPVELRGIATSVLIETGRETARPAFTSALINAFEPIVETFAKSGLSEILPRWRRLCPLLGTEVSVRADGETLIGAAVDVDADGALLLREVSGKVRRIISGEVRKDSH